MSATCKDVSLLDGLQASCCVWWGAWCCGGRRGTSEQTLCKRVLKFPTHLKNWISQVTWTFGFCYACKTSTSSYSTYSSVYQPLVRKTHTHTHTTLFRGSLGQRPQGASNNFPVRSLQHPFWTVHAGLILYTQHWRTALLGNQVRMSHILLL